MRTVHKIKFITIFETNQLKDDIDITEMVQHSQVNIALRNGADYYSNYS